MYSSPAVGLPADFPGDEIGVPPGVSARHHRRDLRVLAQRQDGGAVSRVVND